MYESSTLRPYLSCLVIAGLPVALLLFSVIASSTGNTVVAVVEPRVEAPGLSYSVSVQGKKLQSTKAVLDGLGEAAGSNLMLLVREDLPLRDVTEIVSIALKVGYRREAIHLFSFDEKREGIVAIPGYRYAGYSENPESLSQLLTGDVTGDAVEN